MSDVVEVSVALLRRFADFTKKLTPEQLGALAAGELKFDLVEARKPAKQQTHVDPSAVSAHLQTVSSREEAARYIDGLKLTVAQQKQLAGALGVSLTGAARKDQVRDRIVEHTVGYRLNSQTIRTGAWTEH